MLRFWNLIILMVLSNCIYAQYNLSGTILNKSGDGIYNAEISINNSALRFTSDADGNFNISGLSKPQVRIEVTHLGYYPKAFELDLSKQDYIEIKLEEASYILDEIAIASTWAKAKDPIAQSNIYEEEIQKNNLGQDIPYLLDQTPNTVVTSDAGAGIGYTGIRIRGSDPSRVNVSINGIPLNDSESQGVFWVDL
ncbi:MAG: carboxypeptidase-like regulatory domain-containing protein, partial [Bacteroidota bacterium]